MMEILSARAGGPLCVLAILLAAVSCVPVPPSDGAGRTSATARAEQPSPRVGDGTAPEAFRDLRSHPLEYPGPGRDEPEPTGLREVALGWFGPSDPGDELNGGMWLAANLAVDEANEAGGYKGLPFRLLPAWSDNPWGTGVSLVARMAYVDKVWALIGSVDGPSTHLAEQVVAKARLPLVSPVSTDKSVNLAGVSWMFSCAPGDHLYADLLVESWAVGGGESATCALLRATDHDSRLAASEILKALARRDQVPARVLDFHPGTKDFTSDVEILRELEPQTLFLVAGAEDSALCLRALRSEGLRCAGYGTPRIGRARFLQLAGDAAEGVRFPVLSDSSSSHPASETFRRRFIARAGRPPDDAAAFTYDAARLLIAAVQRAGLNRARIRDAVVRLSPWQGVTGVIEWDPTGQNQRPVTTMAVVRSGRVHHETPSLRGQSHQQASRRQ